MEKFRITVDKPAYIFLICDSFILAGVIGFTLYKLLSAGDPISGGIILAAIGGLGLLVFGVVLLTTVNRFQVDVEGANIHVKDGKKIVDFKVQDISKVELYEKSGTKGSRVLWCEVHTEEYTLKFSSYHKGFYYMLRYLKNNYDNGAITDKVIKKGTYKRLTSYMQRSPERRKIEAKEKVEQ